MPLTTLQIIKLSKRDGVRTIAVQNFLSTLFSQTAYEARKNLEADAKAYGWNAATQRAILAGLTKHFST